MPTPRMFNTFFTVVILYIIVISKTYPCLVAQAAERLTVRGTAAGRRPFATAAEATSSADMDVPFATGDAPGTDPTSTGIITVVCSGATTAVATDKLVEQGNFFSS